MLFYDKAVNNFFGKTAKPGNYFSLCVYCCRQKHVECLEAQFLSSRVRTSSHAQKHSQLVLSYPQQVHQ